MKQFFITFFANLAALLLVFGAPLLLIMILIAASFSASSHTKHVISIERGSILVFDMSLNVADAPEHADLKELREAIVDFKHSGKTVYAYLEAPTTHDYYVASTASVIYMNPFGEMEMPGLASVKMYYKGLFDKYGIDVQVTRVGKYKSAVEPFILTKMSDADREETEKLLSDLWGEFVGAISASRKVDPATFQQLVNTEGYILPATALNAKLIDKLAYFGDVLNDLGKVAPSSDYATVPLPFKQISITDYVGAGRTPTLVGDKGGDKVAVLYFEGEIVDGQGDTTNIGGDRFAEQLRKLRKDDDIKAVVLRVNSPGGSAFASEVIQREVIALKAKKPVIVSMGAYAASGGYWISTYADHIFAEPNTLTGSIGVFGLFMDFQKLGNDFGVTWDTAKTNEYADFETISRPKTPAELALAQARVDDLYGKFLQKVSASRNIPIESLQLIAQGRVWAGNEALNLKLVDEIGGLQSAIEYAASKAKLGQRYKVEEYPKQLSFAENLALLFNNQETPVNHAKLDPVTRQFLKMKSDLKSLQDFNDPTGMYARLPLGFEIK